MDSDNRRIVRQCRRTYEIRLIARPDWLQQPFPARKTDRLRATLTYYVLTYYVRPRKVADIICPAGKSEAHTGESIGLGAANTREEEFLAPRLQAEMGKGEGKRDKVGGIVRNHDQLFTEIGRERTIDRQNVQIFIYQD